MRILISGSNGMLGNYLVKALSSGNELCGIGLGQKPEGKVPFFECDLSKKRELAGVINDFKPEAVIHTAALTDVDYCELHPDKAMQVNKAGTENLLEACAGARPWVCYISTDYVFDGRKKTPYQPDDMPAPLSHYADSKYQGERKVLAYGKSVIVRTSGLFGKGGKNFIKAIMAAAAKQPVLEVVDDQVTRPTYARDLAEGIRFLAGKKDELQPADIFHIANQGGISWCDFARAVFKIAGVQAVVVPVSSSKIARPARRPAYSVLDTEKFEALRKQPLRNWAEALQDYLQEENFS